ncbi:MAG: FeoC-like transcriptional regulator [Anaerolineae bacterium]|nr:FeoC-like transcriptional regulator [Anaerolineae bacterium]
MSALRQVLAHFEQQSGAVSLPVMARELGVDRAVLQDMIDYWVRKGRLREASTPTCDTCGCSHGCPFVFTPPRSYELVTGDPLPEAASCPHCGKQKQ